MQPRNYSIIIIIIYYENVGNSAKQHQQLHLYQ